MRTVGWWLVVWSVATMGASRASAQDTRSLALEAQLASKAGCVAPAAEVLRIASAITRHGSTSSRVAELARARHAMRGCAQNFESTRAAVTSAPPRGRFRVPGDATRVEGPGRFDPRIVVRMIQTRQAAFRACYERELRDMPELEGTVVLAIRIQESGSAGARALPESTLTNAAVLSCSTGVAARFRFTPGPEGGPFTAVMTLTFEPQTS